jgi:DNA-binding LytR/AlgR family response regulator
MIRAFVVDDEELAIKRLVRLWAETGRVEVSGSSTDPIDALAALNEKPVEVLFLDIQMPGMTGFEMLAYLDPQPLVVFTTAFDQYALRAFEVNSIDYLLKAGRVGQALDIFQGHALFQSVCYGGGVGMRRETHERRARPPRIVPGTLTNTGYFTRFKGHSWVLSA